MLRTVEMAAEDLLQGGLDVDVKAVDDLEDETAAVDAARELVADSAVIAVVGHKNSGPSKAAGALSPGGGAAPRAAARARAGDPVLDRQRSQPRRLEDLLQDVRDQ